MKIVSLALLLIVSACAVFAQGALGTITGTVVDPSGAVVGNASIEVKNTATGVVVKTISTVTGNYTAPQLQVGSYDLTVTVSDPAGLAELLDRPSHDPRRVHTPADSPTAEDLIDEVADELEALTAAELRRRAKERYTRTARASASQDGSAAADDGEVVHQHLAWSGPTPR